MTKEETEQLHDSVQLNDLFKPQLKRDTTVHPIEVKVTLPEGLNEDNEHEIKCSIKIDPDFSQLLNGKDEKIPKEVIFALRTAVIRYSLKFHKGPEATFIGEVVQDMNLILEE